MTMENKVGHLNFLAMLPGYEGIVLCKWSNPFHREPFGGMGLNANVTYQYLVNIRCDKSINYLSRVLGASWERLTKNTE